MNTNEITYWVTLASMPKMWTRRKNELYVGCYLHQPQRYSIIDLFENTEVRQELGVSPEEEILFGTAYNQLANNAFLVEDLLSQGYEIIPITSPDYPKSLKKNLGKNSPCVIYVKGNKDLLNTQCTAIVGSRNADNVSLEFTNNIAKKTVKENRTIVSGFAKGVDRKALDSAIEANGKSIIVLPQGITTFSSGFRQYYQNICRGQVVVISTFHPKAPWSVEFAMARNSIIYGLASEIYAAQSDSKGGTWSGVIDGLKKGQNIYVRIPSIDEKNANLLLIQKGATGVDSYGNIVKQPSPYPLDIFSSAIVSEPETKDAYINEDIHKDLRTRIMDLLIDKKMSKDIRAALNLDWSDNKMKNYLRSIPEIGEEKISGRIYFFKQG